MTRRRPRTGKSQETGYRWLRSGNRFGHAADRCSSSASGRRRSADAGRGVPVGVLFEISIVCHVLCSWFWWGAGVSPVLGVVLVVRLVFGSRVRGCSLFLFLVVLLRGCAGVRGAGCGWFRVRGSMWCVRSPSIIECWWGVGRAGPGFLVSGFAGVGLRPVLLPPCWVVGGLGVFFSARRSLVLLVLVPGPQWGSGFRGLGVLGGVGLGWGFFSGFCCSARACLGWGCSGFVWRV